MDIQKFCVMQTTDIKGVAGKYQILKELQVTTDVERQNPVA
jgi:hypothetical protein